MMGGYYAKALAKVANIWTVGPKVSDQKCDFIINPGEKISPVLKQINTKIDFFVAFYSKPDFFPADLNELELPTAWYVYDTHLHLDELSTTAYLFDLVFSCDEPARQDLLSKGLDRVEVLSYAADVDTYYQPWSARTRKHQVGFSGSLGGHPALSERRKLIERLSKKFDLKVEDRTLTGKAVSDFYQDCRVVLNQAVGHEYNMRVPETLLSGRPLLTPEVRGLDTYIQNGVQAETYTLENVEDKIEKLLRDETYAEDMAKRGQQEFLQKHTYDHRAETLVDHLQRELKIYEKNGRPVKNPWLKKAAQFRYHYFRYPGDGIDFILSQIKENRASRFSDKLLFFMLKGFKLLLKLNDRLRKTAHFQKADST